MHDGPLCYPPPVKSAFSLVELSIVLVILGLLVGGVLSGQSLIHAAELRSITTERSNITAAIKTFQDKYFALPGDFSKATDFWGQYHPSASDCPNVSTAAINSVTGACPGNGDGWIDVCNYPANAEYAEVSQFWLHLSRAGLLNGKINATHPGRTAVPEQNYQSRYGRTFWSVRRYPNLPIDANPIYVISASTTSQQNLLTLGGDWGNCAPATTGSTGLFTEDAFNIDTKLDDEKATTGRLQARVGWADANCYSGTNYLLTYKEKACTLIFQNQL